MVYAQRDANSELARRLRKKGGQWLKQVREDAGLTQLELAKALGLGYYTFISQLENGTGRIPPNLLADYADAVGWDRHDFARQVLRYYDPYTHQCLFGGELEP